MSAQQQLADEVIDASDYDYVEKAMEEEEEEEEEAAAPAAVVPKPKPKKKAAPRKKKDEAPSSSSTTTTTPLRPPLLESYRVQGARVLEAAQQHHRPGAPPPAPLELEAETFDLLLRVSDDFMHETYDEAELRRAAADPPRQFVDPILIMGALHARFGDHDPATVESHITDMVHDVAARRRSTALVQRALVSWAALEAGKKK
jgi:hypothetical protein